MFVNLRDRYGTLFVVAAILNAGPLNAQGDPGALHTWATPLVTIGSASDERLRLEQVLGERPSNGYLVRSASSLSADLDQDSTTVRWRWILPQIAVSWNSDIPLSMNDGAMWAGRGMTTAVRAGARLVAGPATLILAPQLVHVQNSSFEFIESRNPSRSPLLPPWRVEDTSADIPLRFGDGAFTLLDPGQSTLTLSVGPMALGASSENQWWGPGIRNAIVMSDNAPGFPHLFVRTQKPIRSAIGSLELKSVVGGLTESLFFDTITSNNLRSISAIAVTFQPVREPGLTVGLARAVYAPVAGVGGVFGNSFDVFTRWNSQGSTDGSTFEQLTSLFGRWLFPKNQFEIYGEWARTELPTSLRDFLTAPHHSQGYTLGLQWAKPTGAEGLVRVQAEATYLESSGIVGGRPTTGYYVSPRVEQGYTQRGQVIGAAIGPGASSQWIAGDYLRRNWQLGLFSMRIRWDEDAFRTRPNSVDEFGHDVSVLLGVRGSARFPWTEISAELANETRLNYLYQNPTDSFENDQFGDTTPPVDIRNLTFRLRVTPAWRR